MVTLTLIHEGRPCWRPKGKMADDGQVPRPIVPMPKSWRRGTRWCRAKEPAKLKRHRKQRCNHQVASILTKMESVRKKKRRPPFYCGVQPLDCQIRHQRQFPIVWRFWTTEVTPSIVSPSIHCQSFPPCASCWLLSGVSSLTDHRYSLAHQRPWLRRILFLTTRATRRAFRSWHLRRLSMIALTISSVSFGQNSPQEQPKHFSR